MQSDHPIWVGNAGKTRSQTRESKGANIMYFSSNVELSENLIRCGTYLSDVTLDTIEGCWRTRVILFEGKRYRHVMLNGEVNELYELKV